MACVYCDGQGKLTREHVYPEFLLTASPEQGLFYSNSAKGYFEADAVVKDTCGNCNHNLLSALDAYIRGLHAKYFARPLVTSRTVSFEFDRLLRWVLKVTYNARRAFGGSPRIFTHLRQYMLGHCDRPGSLMFWGTVLKRSWVNGGWKMPRNYRSSDIRLPELDLGLEVKFCHMLTINSFCFIAADLVAGDNEARHRLSQFMDYQLGAKEIPADDDSFVFDADVSKMDHISHNIRQAEQNAHAYPTNQQVQVGDKQVRLTRLPENHVIRRARIRDSTH